MCTCTSYTCVRVCNEATCCNAAPLCLAAERPVWNAPSWSNTNVSYRLLVGTQVRRDNPRLTTRCEGGHMPVRVVMSRTLDLPEVRTGGGGDDDGNGGRGGGGGGPMRARGRATHTGPSMHMHHVQLHSYDTGLVAPVQGASLWDITTAPTIVMTQRGARTQFQVRAGAGAVCGGSALPRPCAWRASRRGVLRWHARASQGHKGVLCVSCITLFTFGECTRRPFCAPRAWRSWSLIS